MNDYEKLDKETAELSYLPLKPLSNQVLRKHFIAIFMNPINIKCALSTAVVVFLAVEISYGQSCSLACASSACGQVNVSFAPSGGVEFCEGAVITFENTSVTMFDYYVIDWSDGTENIVYDQNPVFHQYSVADSILCDNSIVMNGAILYEVCFKGVLECNGGMDESCASGSYIFSLKVRPRAIIDVDFQYCISDPVPFVNASCNGEQYIWSFGDNTNSTEESPTHTYDTPGFYNVTLIAINDCGSDTTNQVIQVVGDPLAEVQWFADDSVICVNQVVSFQDVTTTVGSTIWTITPPDTTGTIWCFTDTLMTLNSTFIEVQFKQVRQYDITLTARNACGTSIWERTIEVIDTPTVSLASSPALCELNATYTPDVFYTGENHILSYLWTFEAGIPLMSTNAHPTTIFNSGGLHNVSLHISSECGDTTVYTTVFIQSPPDIIMPMVDSLYCTGSDPDTLEAMPPGGIWTGAGIINPFGVFSPQVAGEGTHVLTYMAGPMGCESTDVVSVMVASSAMVEVHDTTVCEDAPPFMLYATPPGGVWSGSGIENPIGIFNPQMSGPGTHDPTYTFSDLNTCTILSSPEVTVDPLPTLMVLDSTSVCDQDFENDLSDVLNLTAFPAGGTTLWRVNGMSSDSLFNGLGLSGFHTIEIEYHLNSCVVRDTAVIEVIPPQDLIISESDTVCISEGSYQLSFNLPSGTWSGTGVHPVTGLIDLNSAGEGRHTYMYIYQEGSSCERSDSVTITINDPGLTLNAGTDVSLCENSVVTYTFTGPTPTGGIWSGEDMLDTIQGTVQVSTLNLDTIYKYAYCIADQAVAGCSACDTVELIVHALPEASFQIAGSTCIDEIFTASANHCIPSSIYQWDFGDTGSATGCNPMHAYANAGNYPVVLQVQSQYDCTNSDTVIVHVTEPPNALFEVDNMEGCAPLSVMVFDSSSGENLQYQWVIGNDTIDGISPGTFMLDGISNDSIFLIELIVSNQCDVSKDTAEILVHPYPDVYFGFNVSSGCSPLLIEFGDSTRGNPTMWFWVLGNGSTYMDSIPPPQIYTTPDDSVSTYIIQLIASNMCGVDSLSDTITVYPPDVMAFIELNGISEGCAPLLINPVSLSTQGSKLFWQVLGPSGQVTGSDSIVAPQFLLEEPGVYQIILTAKRCGEHVDTATVTVLASPLVLFETEEQACTGDTIGFINHSQDIAGSQWSFGDGNSSTLFNPLYVYSIPGVYSIVLSATSATNGCPNSHTESIEITGPPDILVATTPLSGCEPYYATFINSGDQNLSYIWSFGDDTPDANTFAPEHIFMNPGSYTVQVFALNGFGCESDTLEIPVNVWPLPIVDFAFTKAQECGIPLVVQFLNNTSGATSYHWEFGDGQMSNLMHPTHTYLSDGNFDVHMIAVTSNGCLDSGEVTVPVFLQPISAFTVLSPYVCQGTTLQLSNTSTSVNTFCWFVNGNLISIEEIPTTVFETPGVYDITLISKYNDLCQDTLTIADGIEILSSPIADFTYVINQDANILGDVQFYNQSTMFDWVRWDFGDDTQSEELDPWHEYDLNRSIPVTLIAFEDNDGKLTCTDTIIQFIDPEWLITFYAPNVFSPDHGEELVRVFKPVGTGIQEYDISVYSPWGQRVWQSSVLEDHHPVESWNGRLNNTGEELSQGAFTWYARVIFVNGESRVYQGSVTILR